MKKVFVVVGHSNWGKSMTLRKLTSGSVYKREFKLFGEHFFIKRMSNDDLPKSLINFVKKLSEIEQNRIIITLCPNFDNKDSKTEDILKLLQKNCKLYFWVIENHFKGERIISKKEIANLRKYGKVELFSKARLNYYPSKEFKGFIKKYL